MNEFYNLSFSSGNIICLGITTLLLFLIPIAFWLVWHCRHKGALKFKYLLAGAIGFLVSARVLELGVHYLCLLSDNALSHYLNGHTAAFVLYGITMAGLFEECGRYIILRYIMKRDKTRENAVLYGIGHAGIEVWLVILPAIVLELALAAMISSGNVEGALTALNITEENAAAALPTAVAASQFGVGMAVMTTLERILTMFIHIGLTVIVFYGIAKEKKGCLPLAIGLHMVVDLFAALYQRGVVPLWTVEAWAALWTVVIILIAVRCYRRLTQEEEAPAVPQPPETSL